MYACIVFTYLLFHIYSNCVAANHAGRICLGRLFQLSFSRCQQQTQPFLVTGMADVVVHGKQEYKHIRQTRFNKRRTRIASYTVSARTCLPCCCSSGVRVAFPHVVEARKGDFLLLCNTPEWSPPLPSEWVARSVPSHHHNLAAKKSPSRLGTAHSKPSTPQRPGRACWQNGRHDK